MFLERQHVLLVEHHVEVVEIAGQPAHLHVIALADDHDVVAIADEGRHGAMGDVDERTRRLDDVQAERPRCWPGPAPTCRAPSPSRVGVVTCATSCAIAMPLAASVPRTVGL